MADRVLVLNPVSGNENHTERISSRAREHGFDVRTTDCAGDARRLAREAAAASADLVAAAGGDGTVNEVVNGLYAGDALAETTVAVVPAGTGNNFAANVGVESVDAAFEVIENGERRRIDLGIATDRAFVNSCVGGITAEASTATTPTGKRTFGVLAYALQTLETVTSFDPLPLAVTLETTAGSDDRWTGEAMFVLVGNCRRFTSARRAQANVEDGLFEVTIVEEAPPTNLVGDAALAWLFDDPDSSHVIRRRVPGLTVETRHDDPVEYTLDGEPLEAGRLELETSANILEVAVGDGYRPNPDAGR